MGPPLGLIKKYHSKKHMLVMLVPVMILFIVIILNTYARDTGICDDTGHSYNTKYARDSGDGGDIVVGGDSCHSCNTGFARETGVGGDNGHGNNTEYARLLVSEVILVIVVILAGVGGDTGYNGNTGDWS